MPRHNRQSMSFGAVLAGPFGERDAALDIDPRALNEATGHRKRLRIECENADPLCGVAVADAYGEPQVWLALAEVLGSASCPSEPKNAASIVMPRLAIGWAR